MKKRSRRVLALAATLFVLGHVSYSHKYTSEYTIFDRPFSKAYARYKDGLVYIGSEEFLADIETNPGDVLVIDDRHAEDPNMRIISSYKLRDLNDMADVIRILLEYENNNPSEWNRSFMSMLIELYAHNASHTLHYSTNRTTDVDFNNKDEDVYNIMKKLGINGR